MPAPSAPDAVRWNPYDRYRSTLLSPARVRELSQLRPWRPVADAALAWALIVGAWAMVAWHPRWWTVLAAMPLIGSRYYALFILGHDGFHQRLLRRTRWNDLFTDLVLMGPIGAVTHLNKRNHLAHHQHLATAADPDRHKHACFNKADHHGLVSYVLGLESVVMAVRNVFVARAPDLDGQPRETYTGRDLAILAGWQLALIGGLTWQFGWWGYPLLWLAPVFVFTFLADNLRSFLEHSQPMADARADGQRLITHLSNPVERFFLSPMNMNYHATHHLWPSIPYYNLPRADREIRGAPAAAGLEWRRSFAASLWRYHLALPLVDCRASTSPTT